MQNLVHSRQTKKYSTFWFSVKEGWGTTPPNTSLGCPHPLNPWPPRTTYLKTKGFPSLMAGKKKTKRFWDPPPGGLGRPPASHTFPASQASLPRWRPKSDCPNNSPTFAIQLAKENEEKPETLENPQNFIILARNKMWEILVLGSHKITKAPGDLKHFRVNSWPWILYRKQDYAGLCGINFPLYKDRSQLRQKMQTMDKELNKMFSKQTAVSDAFLDLLIAAIFQKSQTWR